MRLFLAIELPEEVRRHLDGVRGDLEKEQDGATDSVSWVKRENWHITLKFLGEMEESRLTELTARLQEVPVETMTLFPERMLYFPKRGPVHVIGVGVAGDVVGVNQLHERVEEAVGPFGVEKEERTYVPHITMGRSRRGANGSDWVRLRDVTLKRCFPGPMILASSFSLMQSVLKAEGAKYIRIAQFPLEK